MMLRIIPMETPGVETGNMGAAIRDAMRREFLVSRVIRSDKGRALLELQEWEEYWTPVRELRAPKLDAPLCALQEAWTSWVQAGFSADAERTFRAAWDGVLSTLNRQKPHIPDAALHECAQQRLNHFDQMVTTLAAHSPEPRHAQAEGLCAPTAPRRQDAPPPPPTVELRARARATQIAEDTVMPYIDSQPPCSELTLELVDASRGRGNLAARLCQEISRKLSERGVRARFRLWVLDADAFAAGRFRVRDDLSQLTDMLYIFKVDYEICVPREDGLPAPHGPRIGLVSGMSEASANAVRERVAYVAGGAPVPVTPVAQGTCDAPGVIPFSGFRTSLASVAPMLERLEACCGLTVRS